MLILLNKQCEGKYENIYFLLDMDIRFSFGNSMIVCGPSKAGKTVWVSRLLEHRKILFSEEVTGKIFWFYGAWQSSYEELKSKIPEICFKDDIENIEQQVEPKSIVVLDDLVKETENNAKVTALFLENMFITNLFF